MLETEPESASTLRLLCLEDDPLVQRALQRALFECELHIVDSVATSSELMLTQRFDAWFLDIRVPDGSGLELLGWARSRGDTTPALVMTGSVDRTPVNAAQALGAEFLYKPYSAANLRAFLSRSCPRARPLDALQARVDQFVARHQLTPRQRDVVDAVARGVERAQLARSLGVSENTIKTQIRRLLDRTGHRDLGYLYRELAGPIG